MISANNRDSCGDSDACKSLVGGRSISSAKEDRPHFLALMDEGGLSNTCDYLPTYDGEEYL